MTVKQKAALQALMVCNSRKDAAEKAGIAERTLRDYFSDPEFVAAYNRLCDEMMNDATRELQRSLLVAIKTLRDLCEDAEVSSGVRSASAFRILDAAPRYTETNNIMQRLEELEREMK